MEFDSMSESLNECVTIKLEVDSNVIALEKYDTTIIKIEEDVRNEDLANNFETRVNPFENIQLEVKEEQDLTSKINDHSAELNHDDAQNSLSYSSTNKAEDFNVKEEKIDDDSIVSYDYPDFTDGNSITGEETVFGNVEVCLQEELNIKLEIDNEQNIKGFDKSHTKFEPGFCSESVTETQLISNKLINTSSTVNNLQDAIVGSQTTKTLVMEILPMAQKGNIQLSSDPEAILPTTASNSMDYEAAFQLNSITSNILPLEQEAYGLLKAKRKIEFNGRQFYCPKCTKVYKTSCYLKRHLAIHESIERRAEGFIRAKRTRILNKVKRMENDIETDIELNGRRKRGIKTDAAYIIKKGINVKKETVNAKKDVINLKKEVVDLKKETVNLKKEAFELKKEGYLCTCGKVFQRRSRLETCLRSHNVYNDSNSCYSCITCSKEFKDKDQLILHRKRFHTRKKFLCKFCPTDYNTRKELFKHLRIHQKVQLMEYKVISNVVKGKQKLKCFMCKKTCSELSGLKSHVMNDHKELYICPHCKSTFKKIIDFINHTKSFHPEVKDQSVLNVLEAFSKLVQAWKCEECDLQFHEADKLALHQAEIHGPELKTETQFQCTDCQRVFISQKGLTSHRRVHHSTESVEESDAVERGIMCLECRKMCKDMNALTCHMRFHSPDRKYPCKFCDFRFATPEKRKNHAEVHTGDMKYVCFICEYQCSSENRLKLHKMSLKHLNMKEYLLTGKPLVEEKVESTSKQDNLKTTSEESVVQQKGNDSSSDTEEATCDICGDKFSSECDMIEHKDTHPFIEFPNGDKPTRIFFK